MAGGQVVLAGMTLIILEVAIALAARERLFRRRAAAVRRGGEALFLARRFHSMAARWSASGSAPAGYIACRLALAPLREAGKGLAMLGDECLLVRINREIGQNARLRRLTGLGLFWLQVPAGSDNAGPLRALQGARLRQCLDEAAVLRAEASAHFSHRMFRQSRESYLRARTLLSTLHRTARLSGRPGLVLEIRTAWEECRDQIEACDGYIVDNEYCAGQMVRLYVKGRIDPGFRQDDGSAPARPDRPGFWGAFGHTQSP
jgi:hypothetical protein